MFQPQIIYSSSVVPHIVSAGNYSLWNLEIAANSNSCSNISIFDLVNQIFAAETIQGRKLFKGGNYMRKYSSHRKVKNPSTQEISETIGCRIYG